MKRKTQIYTYPVVVESCEEGGFFAKCATFQGCHAEGDTYGEAIDNIGGVISAHISARKNLSNSNSRSNFTDFESKIKFKIPVPVC